MTGSIDNALDELDARLREVKREHGQVLMLEAFRRQVRDGATTRGTTVTRAGYDGAGDAAGGASTSPRRWRERTSSLS